MSHAAVDLALTAAVGTALGSTVVQYENGPKLTAESKGTHWAECFVIYGETTVESLGSSGTDRAEGIVQVNMYYPAEQGKTGLHADFALLRAALHAGSPIGTTQKVEITGCSLGPADIEGIYFKGIVTISWWASVARNN